MARSALLFALSGCLFPAVVTLLTFEANRRVGPAITGALGNLSPLFAILVAVLVLGEVPRSGQLAGVAVILAGVLLIIGAPRTIPQQAFGWAIALLLLAAFIRGLVQPVVKLGLADWPNPFAATLIGYLMSATVILSVGASREGRAIIPSRRSGWQWFVPVGLLNGLVGAHDVCRPGARARRRRGAAGRLLSAGDAGLQPPAARVGRPHLECGARRGDHRGGRCLAPAGLTRPDLRDWHDAGP